MRVVGKTSTLWRNSIYWTESHKKTFIFINQQKRFVSLFNCLRQRFSDCALQSPGAPRRVFRAPWEFLAFIFQEFCLRHLILLCPSCAGYRTMYLAKRSKNVCSIQSKNTAFLKIYVRGFVKLTVVIWWSALKKFENRW